MRDNKDTEKVHEATANDVVDFWQTADRSLMAVNAEAYQAFVQRLDAPPDPNPRLRKAMTTKAPWEL